MRIPSILALALLLAVALTVPLAVAGDIDVVGVWDTVSDTPEGDMPGVLTITRADDALEATVEINGAERQVSDVKVEGQTFTMTVMYEGSAYDVEMEVDGDKMTGTYSGIQASGPMTAERRP